MILRSCRVFMRSIKCSSHSKGCAPGCYTERGTSRQKLQCIKASRLKAFNPGHNPSKHSISCFVMPFCQAADDAPSRTMYYNIVRKATLDPKPSSPVDEVYAPLIPHKHRRVISSPPAPNLKRHALKPKS